MPGSRHHDLRSLADEDLMQLAADGEAQAFEVIVDRHGGAAFSLAFRMCGTRLMAEDVVQEAFLSVWRSGAHYDRTRGTLRSWVLSVVHHRAVDAFRSGRRRESRSISDDGIIDQIAEPEQTHTVVATREEAQEVRSALRELPAEQRQVIELAYFGGFTHTQIAAMLALPAGTVKGRMRLGLMKMRRALTDPAKVAA